VVGLSDQAPLSHAAALQWRFHLSPHWGLQLGYSLAPGIEPSRRDPDASLLLDHHGLCAGASLRWRRGRVTAGVDLDLEVGLWHLRRARLPEGQQPRQAGLDTTVAIRLLARLRIQLFGRLFAYAALGASAALRQADHRLGDEKSTPVFEPWPVKPVGPLGLEVALSK
jgi:hypothetical protein